MKRKIFILGVIAAAVLLQTGCGDKEAVDTKALEEITSEVTVSTTAEPETTQAEATVPETTLPVTTLPETTAEPETEKKTEAQTEKKEKKTTVIETTTKKRRNSEYDGGKEHTETRTEREEKYGVIIRKTVSVIYRVLSDGSEEILDEEVQSVSCNRTFYDADYNDLLPAARKNANKYSDEIDEVISIINRWRKNAGLRALKKDSDLTEMANVRAEELAWSGKHSHYRPDGRYFSSIFKDNGYTKGTAGENIGWGYPDAESVCEAWRNSPTHYENIMNPKFTRIGVGVAKDADPSRNCCWVQHFYSD